MTPTVLRPVPAWVRILALVTVLLAVLLLAFGGFVTSFRVGMADPVWPTEPWYLANNYKPDQFGYLIEHTHRILGFLVGGAASLLAFAVWRTEPNRGLRLAGYASLIALLAAYGWYHGDMRKVSEELSNLARAEYGINSKSAQYETALAQGRLIDRVKSWPSLSPIVAAAAAIAVIACGTLAGFSGLFGGWLRGWALFALVAMMGQGLLGGFRVLLNARLGADLAALHGGFGQIAFCILVAVLVLAAPRRAGDSLPEDERATLARYAWWLVALLGVQLVAAVLLRHTGAPLAQRLHLLLAFVLTAMIVWLVVRIRSRTASRNLLGLDALHLAGILAVQLTLGVESYLGKFAAMGAQAQVLPEARAVTRGQAATRTLHQLVGCGLLASAVALAIRAGRRPELLHYEDALREADVPPVASLALEREDVGVLESKAPDVAAMALRPPGDGIVR